MIGQARFTYADADMVAVQRAGAVRLARWRNLAVAYVLIVVFNGVLFAGLNARFGTRPLPSDGVFVIVASAAETILVFGATVWLAREHGRAVLRSRRLGMPWNGDELGGEHVWAWDADRLHVRREHGCADLAWTFVGAWLDAPEVLLLFPSGGRAFSIPERTLAAGWKDAPKVFLFPFGGFALALPKRALAAGDAGRLLEVLRTAGAQERRHAGVYAAGTKSSRSGA